MPFLIVSSLAVFEAVSSGTEMDLVKKATCSSVDIKNNKQYLVMGTSGSEVTLSQGSKSVSHLQFFVFFFFFLQCDVTLTCVLSHRYRLPLDSDALVELWPTDCSSPECLDYVEHLDNFSLDLQLVGCTDL